MFATGQAAGVAAPWFGSEAFWIFITGLAAVIALVLSQLPPLRDLLKRVRVTMQPYSTINITHFIGNPNVHLFVQLFNDGGRSVRIRSLELRLSADGVDLVLPAQTYNRQDNASVNLLFVPFTIEAGKEWSGNVKFFVLWTRNEEQIAKEFIKDLRENIQTKLAAQRSLTTYPPGTPASTSAPAALVEADQPLVDHAIAFYERFNKWRASDYEATLTLTCEPARASATRRFRFTLFEADVEELKARTGQYKYGFGIYLESQNQQEVWARVKSVS
jgi:hypothetical protein